MLQTMDADERFTESTARQPIDTLLGQVEYFLNELDGKPKGIKYK